jgi:hypothetical protein
VHAKDLLGVTLLFAVLGVAAVALHFGRNQFVLPACVVIPHPPEPLVSNFSCIESALRTMREKRSATAALLYTGRYGLIAVRNVLGFANIGCVRASKTVSSATRRSSEAVYLGTNALRGFERCVRRPFKSPKYASRLSAARLSRCKRRRTL